MNDDNKYHQSNPKESGKSAGGAPHISEETRVIMINPEDLQNQEPVKPKPSCLVLVYGEGDLGKRFEINTDHTTIGRSAACTVCINDESVSRTHCFIDLQNDGSLAVRDNKSTNGTLINNNVVRGQQKLQDGDQLKLGGVIFKFITGQNIENDYYNEIYRLTTVDGLTQIYNKRYYLEALTREMSRARRYSRALTLIMFDIDFFKKINDTYGHLAGDYVLSRLAATISGVIRKEDIFARYGGEEFSIILPEIALDNARFFSEKIRRVIEMTQFNYQEQSIAVTISLGIASYDLVMNTPDDFIKDADMNLYTAKRSGRNCSVG